MKKQFSAIPDELKDRSQWLLWDSSNETPRRPHWRGDFGISWSDPDEWHTFEEAVTAADEVDSWGVGYVTASDNPDYARGLYGVIDIDGAADEDDHPNDWVPSLEPFFDENAYIEWSPSHHERGESGIHIPIVGIDVPDWWHDSQRGDHEGVDVLTHKFCTFTGDTLRGSDTNDVAEYGEWVDDWLHEAYIAINGEDPLAQRNTELADTVSGDNGQAATEEWLTEDVVEDALEEIDPDVEYSAWKDIGMALVNHLGAAGGMLFKQWSRGGSKWDRDAEKQAERIINDASSYNFGAATIVHHAKQAGWNPSAAARSVLSDRSTQTPADTTTATDGDDNSESTDADSTEFTESPPGLEYRSGGYTKLFIDSETGEIEREKVITNCHLRTLSRLTHQNGDREFRIEVQPAQGAAYEVDVEPTVLNDKRKFRENVLVGWSTTFDGSQEDLNAIKQFVAAQDAPSRRGTRQIGIHGDEFVAPTGSLRVDGWADDPGTVYTDDSSQLNPLWQLSPEMGGSYDNDDIADMLQLIPQTRREERFLPVLGWFYASVMRPYIMDWEGEFNILNVLGDTGSGKTTTLETLWRMFGMDGELLAADSTAFTQLTAISSTNALPVIFDEYKPADMRDYVVEKLKSYIRLSTRGGVESKGNADRSTDNYHLRAPVCVAGEQPIQGPAEERRTILTTFTRDVISGETPETRSFTELVGGEFGDDRFDGYELERHGLAYYQWVLEQDRDELHGLWHEARDQAASILNEAGVTVADLDDMVMQGFQTVWFGCELYRRFAGSVGVDRKECPVDDRDIKRALLYVADEGTGFEHISHLDRLLALMSRAADADYLQEDVHYTLVSPRGSGPETELCIRLEASFDKVRQYCRDHDVRESDILNSADDYRPRLRDNKEQGIYVSSTSKPTKFEELGQRRSIGFDIEALNQHVDDFAAGAFYGDDVQESDDGMPVLAGMDLGHMQSFTAEVAAISEGEYSREAQGKLKGPHGTYIGFVVPGGNANQLAGGKGETYQFDAVTVRTDDDGLREAVIDDAASVTGSTMDTNSNSDASAHSDGSGDDVEGVIPAVKKFVMDNEGTDAVTTTEIVDGLSDTANAETVREAISTACRKGDIREEADGEYRCLT